MRPAMRIKPLYRLFFALKPTAVIARQTDYFAASIGGGQDRILPDHQHLTLAVTADHVDYPYAVVKALLRAGTGILAEPFDLLLDQLSFSNRSAALRPSGAVPLLSDLQRSVATAMRGAGVGLRPDWSFSPHQTLFYRDGRPEKRKVDGFSWRVKQFVLLCSHVGHRHHEILGTWPLKGDGQLSLF
ncbi:2'-5' RNA ligase family protein [Sphingobium mellinum]|uniref:2'-5' RNA ligase family protein n=1 Tax=Sphingobium mellinum TaxID=1387166 RepID=UPI0030ED7724